MIRGRQKATVALSLLLTACASAGQAPSAGQQSAAASRQTVAPEPSDGAAATEVDLRPDLMLAVSDGSHQIRLAEVGGEVWASGNHSIARIDTQTLEITTVETPVAGQAVDSFGATADAVWLGDWERGKVYRLDPTTGAVLAELRVSKPIRFWEAHGKIWVGSSASKTMVTIDPAGTEATVTDLPYELIAGGSAWGIGDPGEIIRVVIDTGEQTLIDVPEPAGPGDCSVRGSLDSLWVVCHENDKAARINAETNSVVATVDVGSPLFGGVHAVERWALFVEGPDEAGAHEGRIVRVDLSTNRIDRIFNVGPDFDPDVGLLAADALWLPMGAQGEVWRIPLVALTGE